MQKNFAQKIMTNYNPHSNIKISSASSSSSCAASPNSSAAAINSIMVDDWELHTMFKQILHKFKGDIKSTFSHLGTVHNETCGCQIGLSSGNRLSSAEITNKVWNQKKVPFMELQKQSGLDFDDYLNRVLRLLVDNNIQNVRPLPESEFWQTLRQTSFCQPKDSNGCQHVSMEHCNQETIEEDLADIHSLIASDIGAESSQNLFLQPSNSCSTSVSTSVVSATSSQQRNELTHPATLVPLPSVPSYLNPKLTGSETKSNPSNPINTKSDSLQPPPELVPFVKYGSTEQKRFHEKLNEAKSSQIKLEVEAPNTITSNDCSFYNFDYADPINGVDELAKLKRREKHKAPIDCSGVSKAFGYTWFCKMCNLPHSGKHECHFYRNFHHPKYILKNLLHSSNGLPKELIHFPQETQRTDKKGNELELGSGGIYTGINGLNAFTRLGPLRGRECAESEIDFDEDRARVWLVYCDNGIRKCIATSKR